MKGRTEFVRLFLHYIASRLTIDPSSTSTKDVSKSVMGCNAISKIIIQVKLHRKPFHLSIPQVYAPTSASTEEEIGEFYSILDDAHTKCGSQDIIIVSGELNAIYIHGTFLEMVS